jgi:hypothetical protein
MRGCDLSGVALGEGLALGLALGDSTGFGEDDFLGVGVGLALGLLAPTTTGCVSPPPLRASTPIQTATPMTPAITTQGRNHTITDR